MSTDLKCTVLGGGSPFVHALLEGLAGPGERWCDGPALHLSLFDIAPERCERWLAYGRLLAQAHGLRLRLDAPAARDEALRDANVVLLSIGFREADELAQRMREKYGFERHSIHDGPPAFASAATVWPYLRQLGEDVARLSPGALLVVLPNPTDVLAEAVERATGVRSVGLCVEVPHTREHLAYYWDVAPDDIVFEHAGVNHDGWVLRFTVRGQDGYKHWAPRVLDLPQHPGFHPGNHGFVEAYRLTGYLRASIYHNWPLLVGPHSGPQAWHQFGASRGKILTTVDEAIAARRPLTMPTGVPPESRPVKYLATGQGLSKLLRARATGRAEVIPLQVRNHGAVTNFAPDVRVEVPTLVAGERVQPLPVGELPEWLGGVTRLLAVQRRYAADYLVGGDAATLRQALFTLPTVATVETLESYAREVDEIRKC